MTRRRWAAAGALAIVAAASAGLATSLPAQTAPPAPAPLVAQTDLAVPVTGVVPFGGGAGGEVWGFGRTASTGGPVRLTERRDGAWRLALGPEAADGTPLADFEPASGTAQIHAGEMSPDGTGALLGTVPAGGARAQVLLMRKPGGRFTRVPDPPAEVLLPGERLYGEGRVVLAAVDGAVLVAPEGGEPAVLRYDGSTWTREEVVAPEDGFAAGDEVAAVAADAAGAAWLAVRPSAGRPAVLHRRMPADAGPRWEPAALTNAGLLEGPVDGVQSARLPDAPADALTVADGHVWVDLRLATASGAHDAALHLRAAGAGGAAPELELDATLCDVPAAEAPVCSAPLGADLAPPGGTRSFAFAGGGAGTRVLAGATSGAGQSTAGAPLILTKSGARWGPGIDEPGAVRPAAVFTADGEGWIGAPLGATHITRTPEPGELQERTVPPISGLVDIAPEPGRPAGAPDARALALAPDGDLLRFTPGSGWLRELDLGIFDEEELAERQASRAPLRALAWGQRDLVLVVGDTGRIVRREGLDVAGEFPAGIGLPVALIEETSGTEEDLNDVVAGPADAFWVVGDGGTVLFRDGDVWQPSPLPPAAANADLYGVALAAGEPVIVGDAGVLVRDGAGGWRLDDGYRQVAGPDARPGTIAALADGGVVVDGRWVRDSDGKWRAVDAPPLEVVAVAAYRDEAGTLRSIVSTTGRESQPGAVPPVATDAPRSTGYVLRETANGWRDDDHRAIGSTGTADLADAAEPVRAFALDDTGRGWAVGGTFAPPVKPDADAGPDDGDFEIDEGLPFGRLPKTPYAVTPLVRRYRSPQAEPRATESVPAPVPLTPSVVRFAVGGGPQCLQSCSASAAKRIEPDVLLDHGLRLAGTLAADPVGPRGMLLTGGRSTAATGAADAQRYADLLRGGPLPVFGAAGPGDRSPAFDAALGGVPGPYGSGPLPAGIEVDAIPADLRRAPGPVSPYYAFDSTGSAGTVRVVVIDLSGGSLAAGGSGQRNFLQGVLADARADDRPAIVVGGRALDPAAGAVVADDGAQIVELLRAEGASAYIGGGAGADPEAQGFGARSGRLDLPRDIPPGARLPTFTASGFAHPESPVTRAGGRESERGLSFPALGLLEIEAGTRIEGTNRVPVRMRTLPLLASLGITGDLPSELRAGEAAAVPAVGRRPAAGGYEMDEPGGGDEPIPARGNPLVALPASDCGSSLLQTRTCPEGTELEARYTSSDPAVAGFVTLEPTDDGVDVTRPEELSPYLCARSPGTVTVTVTAGGLSASRELRVAPGRRLGAGRFGCDSAESEIGETIEEVAPAPAQPQVPAPQLKASPPPAPPEVAGIASQPPTAVAKAAPPPAAAPGPAAPPPAAGTPAEPAAASVPASVPKVQPPSPPNLTGGLGPQPAQAAQPGSVPQPAGVAQGAGALASERAREAARESSLAAVRATPEQDGSVVGSAGLLIAMAVLSAGAGGTMVRRRAPAHARADCR